MIAIETGAIGHNICVVTACSTGTNCVGEAAELIRRGDVHTVIAGSSEMPLLEVGPRRLRQHARPGLAARGPSRSPTSRRPFDRTRDGFVLGEGGGGLILEDLELAKARGAHIYAEVVGYGSAADGWDMIQPIEGGTGSARAMRQALERRGVPADEVDVINPHGTSTPVGDKREAEAIWTVFGDRASASRRELAISGTKSMTGHMMGAAGAFEAFATVMTVAEQCVPPTINYRDFDPEADLWVFTETRQMASATPCRTTSASAATTAPSSSSAGTAAELRPGGRSDRGPPFATIPATRGPAEPRQEGAPCPPADPARRAVVTGLGAVMPIGNDFETYWRNLRDARDRHAPDPQRSTPSDFEVQIAAEVLDFDPTTVDGRQDGAPDEPVHPPRDGRRQGGGRGVGIDFAAMDRGPARPGRGRRQHGRRRDRGDHRRHPRPRQKGPRFVSPFAVPALSGSMAGCMLSMEYGLTGPVITQVAACATSVIAFHDALRLIATGECDVVLAGGSEAPVVPMGVAALANMGALSKRNDSPETASRPFDGTRDGFVLGEGAGVVVVESARARAAARRDADRRDPGRRADRRRVPHQRPGPDRPRPGPRDDQRAAQLGRGARRDRLDRRPRHLDVAQRRDRDAGDQGGLRLRGARPGRSARRSR